MSNFINELKRRNVIKAALAYAVSAWVLLQVLSMVLPTIGAPEWVFKTIMLLVVIGFPIWIFFSWVYEVTPEGIKKTTQVATDQSITHETNKRLNILILVGLVAAIAVSLLRPDKGFLSGNNNIEYAIAVLPFDDMSPEKDTEWFCDGMTEDILTHLSKIKGLKVISRTSTERYKNTDKSVPEIAAELGVSYVVEGSVRKQNDDVLITAQLINASDEHIWAENYNEKMTDVFKVQGDVSQKIAKQLKISISPRKEKELNAFPTENIEAYEAYLKGRNLLDQMDIEAAKTAVTFFEKAIELDSEYADAYAELGFVQMTTLLDTLRSESNINKALELNPNSSRANSYKGLLLSFAMKKPKEALDYLEKAIELNPSDAKAHDVIAAYYCDFSRSQSQDFSPDYEKALYHINKAIELDPFSTQSHFIKTVILTDSQQLDEAEAYYLKNESKFNVVLKKQIASQIINRKVRQSKTKDQEEEVRIYKDALKKFPVLRPRLNRLLGAAVDGVYNDNKNYLKYTQLAYQLDSTSRFNAQEYYIALIENRKFDDAKRFRDTENYKNVVALRDQLGLDHYYYYTKGDYKEALEILEDSLLRDFDLNKYVRKVFAYAQLGNKAEAFKLLRSGKISNVNKAMAFAILKEKDSLYYYLNETEMTPNQAKFPNSRAELNPYRKDPEYIAFLKKYRFPVDKQIH